MNGLNNKDSGNDVPEDVQKKRKIQNQHAAVEAKRLEAWLTFTGKIIWPLLLVAVFFLFQTEVKTLFNRLISLKFAGQELTFSENLKEPVINIASLGDITDKSFDIRKSDINNKIFEIQKNTFKIDAYFQVSKKYVVLRTSEIPEDKSSQAIQMFQIMEIIRSSIICGDFIGLIVLDDKERYIGSFDRDFFLETIIPWSNLVSYPVDKPLSAVAEWLVSCHTCNVV